MFTKYLKKWTLESRRFLVLWAFVGSIFHFTQTINHINICNLLNISYKKNKTLQFYKLYNIYTNFHFLSSIYINISYFFKFNISNL